MQPLVIHTIILPSSFHTTERLFLTTDLMMEGYLQQHEQYNLVPTVNTAGTNGTLPAAPVITNSYGEADLGMAHDTMIGSPPGHTQAFHVLHARTPYAPTCQSCGAGFLNNHQLTQHGMTEGHHAFACICGSTFGRLDTLRRHVNSLNLVPGYECEYCSKHDGNNAFARLDNLKQHLKAYHRFEDKFLNTIRQRGTRQISVQAETASQTLTAWPMVYPSPPVVFGQNFMPAVFEQSFMPGMDLNAGQDVVYGAGPGQDFNPVRGVGPFPESGNGQVDAALPAELDPQLASATGFTFDLLNFNCQF